MARDDRTRDDLTDNTPPRAPSPLRSSPDTPKATHKVSPSTRARSASTARSPEQEQAGTIRASTPSDAVKTGNYEKGSGTLSAGVETDGRESFRTNPYCPDERKHEKPVLQQATPDRTGDLAVTTTEQKNGVETVNAEANWKKEPSSSMAYPHMSGGPPPHGYHSAHHVSSSQYAHQSNSPSNQYGYLPVTTSHDSYRGHPPTSNPTPLPSMRTIDPMAQQLAGNHSPHHGGIPYPMPMGTNTQIAPVSPGLPIYPQHSLPAPGPYGYAQDPLGRYNLPQDPRLLGNRDRKKEIKRRTKTGCLTCRKRRIKCDEAHPTCNNCKKSKRDCAGYDPIFKSAGGSQNNVDIQPATPGASQRASGSPLPSTGSVSSNSASPSASAYGAHSSVAPSGFPASSSHVPVTAAPTTTRYDPVSASKYEAAHGQPSHYDNYREFGNPRPIDRTPIPDHNTHPRAQKMKVEEIIQTLGSTPPLQAVGQDEERVKEITKIYHEMYAGGLSAFLETNFYYFTDNGKMTFPQKSELIDNMVAFLRTLEAVQVNDQAQMAFSGILETRIVWELAKTAYDTQIDWSKRTMGGLPPDGDPGEAHCRVRVVEALLCGEYLEKNPLTPPFQDPDPHRSRQYDFWHSLAEFSCRHHYQGSPMVDVQRREEILNRMRYLLDGRENRDVLYSIAVVRELAPRFDQGYSPTLPTHLDEADPKHRLAVASKFILDEAQSTGGTTNVVRRLCDIAGRAFVNPGVNISRNPVAQ